MYFFKLKLSSIHDEKNYNEKTHKVRAETITLKFSATRVTCSRSHLLEEIKKET
jgi:hypothetical protein